MTAFDPLPPRRPLPSRPRPKRRSPWRVVVALVFVVVAFALGLALGEAIHDNPKPGVRTDTRLLKPIPLPPERETVTVVTTVRGR